MQEMAPAYSAFALLHHYVTVRGTVSKCERTTKEERDNRNSTISTQPTANTNELTPSSGNKYFYIRSTVWDVYVNSALGARENLTVTARCTYICKGKLNGQKCATLCGFVKIIWRKHNRRLSSSLVRCHVGYYVITQQFQIPDSHHLISRVIQQEIL